MGETVKPEELRTQLLLGKDAMEILHRSTVLTAGVGGVGSYAIEALARSGIGHLIIVDKDDVDPTNLNRQIMAGYDTIGQSKCVAMKNRIAEYNQSCEVACIQAFFSRENAEELLKTADFAIDAIDTVASKLDFMEACMKLNVPFISSLGMGNRLDPSAVRITDLWKTSGDPLARCVRKQARKRNITKAVPVMFSAETPRLIQHEEVNPDGTTRKDRIPPASAVFVPAAAGLLAASAAVRSLLGEKIL
ncbi:MAG: tRNA threonylcarbamoyladenosine dehydratase [Erysipelotrichia bacterium]|nr:tRNA threonylcarbamoyladenosine dehydratase [Erysipelotrichia bacterium]